MRNQHADEFMWVLTAKRFANLDAWNGIDRRRQLAATLALRSSCSVTISTPASRCQRWAKHQGRRLSFQTLTEAMMMRRVASWQSCTTSLLSRSGTCRTVYTNLNYGARSLLEWKISLRFVDLFRWQNDLPLSDNYPLPHCLRRESTCRTLAEAL